MDFSNIKVVVIVPAHNEEEHISRVLTGLYEQILKPFKVIIVDDRSQDDTYIIAKEYADKYSETFKVVKKSSTKYFGHWELEGNRIAEAFNFGINYLSEEWDYLAKIDADMVLNPLFFNNIVIEMERDRKIGIAAGLVMQQSYADTIVRGGCRVYKKECWMEITDLPAGDFSRDIDFRTGFSPPLGGWDTFLVNKSKMLGWENKVVNSSKANMLRDVGGKTLKAQLITNIRRGNTSRRNGYWFLYFLGRILRNVVRKPLLLGGLFMAYGWIWSWWNKKECYDEQVAEWLKQNQKKIVVNKLLLRN
jgi:glycosyltransferase involved in cell wall biosynthesis